MLILSDKLLVILDALVPQLKLSFLKKQQHRHLKNWVCLSQTTVRVKPVGYLKKEN